MLKLAVDDMNIDVLVSLLEQVGATPSMSPTIEPWEWPRASSNVAQ